jgi:Tfp pilus assembly protein PilF
VFQQAVSIAPNHVLILVTYSTFLASVNQPVRAQQYLDAANAINKAWTARLLAEFNRNPNYHQKRDLS